MPITIKRIYERPDTSDSIRILVDRLWPRGMSKSTARIDEWSKELAPSDGLRQWFGHRPERWNEFVKRYRRELGLPERLQAIHRLRTLGNMKNVVLLFAAKDEKHCHARVLYDILNNPHINMKLSARNSGHDTHGFKIDGRC